MTKLILGCLLMLPAVALADVPPAGPDFDAHMPAHRGSLTASSSDKAIPPSDDVVFANDSAALLPEAEYTLWNTAQWLAYHAKYKIVLEGHASSLGTAAHNEDLASRRVGRVRDALYRLGVPSDRIVMVIYGAVGAQKDVNPNDRRVILFASTQPTQVIATAALRHEGALSAAWTKNGALFIDRPVPQISQR